MGPNFIGLHKGLFGWSNLIGRLLGTRLPHGPAPIRLAVHDRPQRTFGIEVADLNVLLQRHEAKFIARSKVQKPQTGGSWKGVQDIVWMIARVIRLLSSRRRTIKLPQL